MRRVMAGDGGWWMERIESELLREVARGRRWTRLAAWERRLMAVAAVSDRHGAFLEDLLEMVDLLDLACWREVETLPEAEIYWQALEVLAPIGEGKGWWGLVPELELRSGSRVLLASVREERRGLAAHLREDPEAVCEWARLLALALEGLEVAILGRGEVGGCLGLVEGLRGLMLVGGEDQPGC